MEGTLGTTGGKAASWAPSLVLLAAFFTSLDDFAPLEEMLAAGRALAGLSLPSSTPEETGSALEPEEPEVCMA